MGLGEGGVVFRCVPSGGCVDVYPHRGTLIYTLQGIVLLAQKIIDKIHSNIHPLQTNIEILNIHSLLNIFVLLNFVNLSQQIP